MQLTLTLTTHTYVHPHIPSPLPPHTPIHSNYIRTHIQYVHTLICLVMCMCFTLLPPPCGHSVRTCMDGTWLSLESKPSNKTSKPRWWAIWLSFWNCETTGCNSKLSPPAARHTDIRTLIPKHITTVSAVRRPSNTYCTHSSSEGNEEIYVLQFQPYAITARRLGHQRTQTSVQLLSISTLWVAFSHPTSGQPPCSIPASNLRTAVSCGDVRFPK